MSRIGIIAVGAALVLFVYQGATATDTGVGVVTTAIQTALESEMEIDWLGEWFVGAGDPLFVAIPALVGILLLLFGGLPLAIFGLLLKVQIRVSYAVLMLTMVTTNHEPPTTNH